MAVVGRPRVVSDQSVEIQSEWVIGRITEVGTTQSGSGSCVGFPHAWIEQSLCQNSYGYEDNTVDGLSGTLSVSQAYAIDGSKASVNDIVLVRPRAMDDNGNPVYEFFKGGGGGNTTDCPHVSSVQCTGGILTVTYDTTCVEA